MTRLADAPTTTVERVVDAPVDVVWGLITDPDLPARFSDEFRGGVWESPHAGPAPGATFIGTNENERMGRWQVRCWVEHCDPGRTFGWAVRGMGAAADVDPAARWRFDLTSSDDGGAASSSGDIDAPRTLVRYTVVLGPGRSGLTAAIAADPAREEAIVGARLAGLRRNMVATLDGIAEVATGS